MSGSAYPAVGQVSVQIQVTMPKHFLQLRSSAPGLPGPYLLENLNAYRWFDNLGCTKPSLILAIGGAVKRQWLMQHAIVKTAYDEEEHSVSLVPVEDDAFLLDCELHLQLDQHLPRLKAGLTRRGAQPLLLAHAARHTQEIAFALYCDVLSHFSNLILLFVPDFGGLPQLIEFLCFWLSQTMAKNFPTLSRILLVHDKKPARGDEVDFELMASMASHLRQADPTRSYSAKAIREMMRRCFQLTNCTVLDGTHQMWLELHNSRCDRIRDKMDLSALHLKTLLRSAISQFADAPSIPFNAISASRLQYTIPERLQDQLSSFLAVSKDVDGATDILSSALVMDAYPPGMHSR